MSSIESTWATRDLPILVAAYRRVESQAPQSVGQLEEMRQELGLTVQDFAAGLEALEGADPPHIELMVAGGWSDERARGRFVTGVSERAHRELGAWPSTDVFVEQLAAALARAADEEQEPERKSRLREAAEVLGGMARDIGVNVISAKIGQP
jgi:hypothetical protein